VLSHSDLLNPGLSSLQTVFMLLLGLAIAPGLAICLYIFYRDQYNREPAFTLLISFFWGILATVPAIVVEMAAKDLAGETVTGIIISSVFFIALVEEFCKYLPLRYYSFSRKSFDEPLDGIIHAVMIGMGFATLENIGYVLSSPNGLQTGMLRMFTSVPGHATFAVIMGFYVGKARFDYVHRKALLLKGILLATFFHGVYDSCLFLIKVLPQSVSGLLLILGALASLITAMALSLRLIRLHRRVSHQYYRAAPVLTIKNASPQDIPLIRSLAEQIWPKAYASILSQKQIVYMMTMIYSSSSLKQQMEKGDQFIIAYNTGLPVGFASFSKVETEIYKLHKLYVLQSQQGKGVGKFMIEQIINDIKPNGATVLRLNVNRHNTARLFYEKTGFVIVGSEDIDIGNGYFMNDYVMEKKLNEEINSPIDPESGSSTPASMRIDL
jgi:RsiW-degrading membrane proteinase PrsW (M82 family)/ribosomal protein S18 acetylase RimI-like enzyme